MPRHARPRISRRAEPLLGAGIAARGAVRGLINPWFATATGVMIAASLWVYHPHAQLKLPVVTLGRTHCTLAGCVPVPTGSKRPSLTSTSGERLHKPGARRHAGGSDQSAGVGAAPAHLRSAVGYRLAPSWPGSVLLVITLPKRASGNWKLAFSLPGDEIQTVEQADWQKVGSDGVTVTGAAASASGATAGGSGATSTTSGRIEFTVLATGTATVPAGCVFNGASCTFHVRPASTAAG